MKKGVVYDLFDQDGPDADPCGQVKIETRSEDTLWVKYGQEKWRNQAFVTAILREAEGEKKEDESEAEATE